MRWWAKVLRSCCMEACRVALGAQQAQLPKADLAGYADCKACHTATWCEHFQTCLSETAPTEGISRAPQRAEEPEMKQVDEKAFTPMFLASLSEFELAMMQHDLRQFPEDKPYLDQVLAELARRAKEPAK
jgi:hypothetical protein